MHDRLSEEVGTLRTQLAAAHAQSTRLQEELRASEGELTELHEGYTLVWDELQQQRAAMKAAHAQCQALQAQVDKAEMVRSTPRTERVPNSARSVR